MTTPAVTYAVRLEPLAPLAVLDTQLYAAGLRRNAGPGERWCSVAVAVDVLLPLMDAEHAAGMTYDAGMAYIEEWLGIDGKQG